MTISQASVIDEYVTRTPDTCGCLGHLTASEEAKLAQLWRLILEYLDTSGSTQIPVTGELLTRSRPDTSWKDLDDSGSEDNDDFDFEEMTRRAWEFTKGDSGKRKLNFLGRRPKASREQRQLERHVRETTQQYMDRKAKGKSIQLIPPSYIPSFKHPSTETRNLRDVFWAAASIKQHPDIWIHRFLRANSWDPAKAFVAVKSLVEWRTSENLDQLNWEGEVTMGLDELRLGLMQLIGHDRLGNPLVYSRVRRIMPRANSLHVLKRYLVYQFEALQHVTRSGQRIAMLFDFTGFSMDNTPLGMVIFMVTMGIKQYAESSSVLILLVDSWLFSNFWSLVRPFLDANLSARIVFAKTADEVRVFVDQSQLPEELGGSNTFAAKFSLPTNDENVRLFDRGGRRAAEHEWRQRVDEFEAATCHWCSSMANGDGKLAEIRDQAASNLDHAERSLSRFTRARNTFDRLGLVGPDGCLQLPIGHT
ncbi:phosphatidylinositol transfer protein csr1 [Coemansia sp. RSA 552]|nr:phosphatidylinositol transfer protein csr1 [Coemansia sp. RSA 552]